MPLRVEERMRLTPIMSDDAHVKRRHELAICCFVGKLYEQAPSRIDSHYLKLRVSGDMIDCRTRLNLVEHHRNLMTYLWNFVSIYIRKGNRSTSDLAVAILNFGMARHDISSDVALWVGHSRKHFVVASGIPFLSVIRTKLCSFGSVLSFLLHMDTAATEFEVRSWHELSGYANSQIQFGNFQLFSM